MTKDDSIIRVFAYRQEPNRLLRQWLDSIGIPWDYAVEERGIERARNVACAEFLRLERRFLLMLDADMVPLNSTREILAGGQPLAWCGYVGREGLPGHVDTPGCGCMRIRRDVFDTLVQPWFEFGESVRATEINRCECDVFTEKVRAAGYESVRLGVIGHLAPAIFFPKTDGTVGRTWPAACGYYGPRQKTGD
jgi:hypothetical protein